MVVNEDNGNTSSLAVSIRLKLICTFILAVLRTYMLKIKSVSSLAVVILYIVKSR